MSSQPEPANAGTPASQIVKPLREPAALALVGANALLLLSAMVDLAFPAFESDTFTRRAASGFFAFVGLVAIVLPLSAVLLATYVQPPVRRAKLITQVALGEYAVSALFAVITFFTWLIGSLAQAAFREAFSGLLSRAAYLGLFGIAAFAVFSVWRKLYYVPKPKPQPGLYGKPQQPPYGQYPQPGHPYGQPAAYPAGQPQTYGGPDGQPGYPSTYGQPAYPSPAPASAPPAPASAPPAPASAPPAPASAPPAPASAPPAPASAPPVPASAPPVPASAPPVPASAPPVPAPTVVERTQPIARPAGDAAGAEATQVVARPGGDAGGAEATQVIRPGN